MTMTTTIRDFCKTQMTYHILQSNLIEGVESLEAVDDSLEAWHMLMEYEQITLSAILGLHTSIMVNQLGGHDLGVLRNRNVQVLDGVEQFLPHFYVVPELMDQWVFDMASWQILEPKAMHVRFEKIHPFVDGNGRVGRMLMWWHEAHLGRIPTLILNANKLEYFRWFWDRYI